MARKAISFLGYSAEQRYRPTTYVYNGQACSSSFMAHATASFFQSEIDELLVLVTPDAFRQNFADLEQAIAGLVPVRPVHIPSGQNADELWLMFAAIAGEIEQDDRIIFDITNGFRSLPVLALLAASFVRVVRGATVERMIYGAFDAQDKQSNHTPVFDLTPFVRLLDFTTATDALLKYGRADDLAVLEQGSPLAAQLGKLTDALQTSRPAEVMETAVGLEAAITEIESSSIPAQQPFALLLDRIGREYQPFALRRPREPQQSHAVLQKQLAMIQWYREKGLYVQAMTLAREWLVSAIIGSNGGDLFAKGQRTQAERILNNRPESPPSTFDEALVPRLDLLRALWLDLREIRNSLAHGGMLHDAPRTKKVIERVGDVCDRLQVFRE